MRLALSEMSHAIGLAECPALSDIQMMVISIQREAEVMGWGIRPERGHGPLVREARLGEESDSGGEGFLVTLESYGGDPPSLCWPLGQLCWQGAGHRQGSGHRAK